MGPRQVGKTTAQFQIIADVLDEGVHGRNVLRVQFDELASLRGIEAPILAIADWFERNVSTARFNELARAGRQACLFFDEVQNIDAWDAQLCLVDHGLRASWLQEQVPLTPEALAARPELNSLAGHLAESVFGSVASTIHGLDIAHVPERTTDREVDFVLTVGAQRVPVEIKYQRRVDPVRDTLGIRSFVEKSVNNAAFGLLITQDDAASVDDPRIVTLPLSTFMLLR